MATFPQAFIPRFPAGFAPQQPDFTTLIQNNFSFITNRVVLRARLSTAQNFITGDTVIAFNNIDEDPYSGWSSTATGAQAANSWLAPYTGLYEIHLRAGAISATEWSKPRVSVTGGGAVDLSGIANNGNGPGGANGFYTVAMLGGSDYIQGIVNLSTGVAAATNAGDQSMMEILYLSG